MWLKWFPWRMIIKSAAKKSGFLDPLEIVSRLQNFAQPAEVAAPLELLRAGAVFHARGLINSQAIQHNLDWIWPYWVECQFDPRDESFVPRAFSFTHVNLTQRNWTAVGLPDTLEWPIVDARGLVTPLLDGWSIDCWIIQEDSNHLIPSKQERARQELMFETNLNVITETQNSDSSVISAVHCDLDQGNYNCRLNIKGVSSKSAWLAVLVRPYNPEGISFIHDISRIDNHEGWLINDKNKVLLDTTPEHYVVSNYEKGDSYSFLTRPDLLKKDFEKQIKCKVGMASAAAVFSLKSGEPREINVTVPLVHEKSGALKTGNFSWDHSLEDSCRLTIGDERVQFLYDAAVRTLILHSPKEVYPGPYTYKRFWFRDAALILYAMTAAGLVDRAKRVLDIFPKKQTPMGYFLSQEGEWDSNGEALWIFHKYCELTGRPPDPAWKHSIISGANWILRKRLSAKEDSPHAGLFPAGFSAEHLGPNDYYYWDDFWGVSGLKAAAEMASAYGDNKNSRKYKQTAAEFLECVEKSLRYTQKNLGRSAIPAAPYRRMDAGAIGSIVGGYPLRLLPENDPRLIDTVRYLLDKCLVHGGFFQDMTHSGINPYLTLHMAQVLLRAGDPRYFDLLQTVAGLATSTGQWPEAIHPRTKGGCMGDGQHVWAAAEWVMMIRNCFLREEDQRLILCSGLAPEWIKEGRTLKFGPALTAYGKISLEIQCLSGGLNVSWQADWYKDEPVIEIRVPGYVTCKTVAGERSVVLKKRV